MRTVPENGTVTPTKNDGFRLAIVVATALVFATAFGWLACIQRLDSGEVEFQWQGTAWLWIAVGLAAPVYFWRQIWPKQNVPSAGSTGRVIKGWAALLIPSLMWLAYPLRFISGPQLLNVIIGLGIAATVLTFGGWMVFRLIKGFADEEVPAASTDSIRRPESDSSGKKQA
jgi:hypothetical protein